VLVLHQGSIYRLAAKEVFYHGTASGENDWLLKRILKEGLIPDPKERVWSGDKGRDPEEYTYWQHREKESLGGIYFSTDPKRITTYMQEARMKIGGDAVAVIAQLETRSPEITLDEEALFGYYRAAVGEYLEQKHLEKYERRIVRPDVESLPRYLVNMDIDWEDVARWFIEERLKKGVLQAWPNISEQRIEAIAPLLAKALRWQAEFLMASYYAKKEDWAKRDYKKYGEQDPEEALQRYRILTEKVLQKFRELAQVPKKKSPHYTDGHEVRVTEPVTYRGANKILAVLQIQDVHEEEDVPYYRVGKVIYSTPQASVPISRFIEAMKQSWSPNMKWVDSGGKVLYDNPKDSPVRSIL
jgi:hypothetical protein